MRLEVFQDNIGHLANPYEFTMESDRAIRSPGPTVERKQARIDVSVTHPKMIMVTLGGIRSPRMEETVTRAVA